MNEDMLDTQFDRLLTGYWISQAIHVAAKLGLGDALKNGPRTAEELAKLAGAHAPSLYRLLRGLASVGLFAEDDKHRFALTALGARLRGDVAGSKRALAIMTGEEHYRACAEMLYSVQTGKPAFDKVCGMPIFDFLSRYPEKSKVFDEAMVGVHGRETGAMLDAYDFTGIGVLADVGGGNGSVLTAILARYPMMHGILYDLSGVADRAKAGIQAAGLAGRCQVMAGSFFESVPEGADAYIMRHIIHDWDEEKSIRILRNIHRSMKPDARLLIVEGVIPPGDDPSFEKLLDLAMLILTGGKERTETEYRSLFNAGGFRLTRIVPTRAGVSVLEGHKM